MWNNSRIRRAEMLHGIVLRKAERNCGKTNWQKLAFKLAHGNARVCKLVSFRKQRIVELLWYENSVQKYWKRNKVLSHVDDYWINGIIQFHFKFFWIPWAFLCICLCLNIVKNVIVFCCIKISFVIYMRYPMNIIPIGSI